MEPLGSSACSPHFTPRQFERPVAGSNSRLWRSFGVIGSFLARIVELARRRAGTIAVAILLLTVGAGFYTVGHLTIDTEIDHMLPSGLDWRQDERALDKAFPQNNHLLVVVIDGQTGDLADRAARELAERMRLRPDLFTFVRRPDGGEFFDRNGPLFLSTAELQVLSDKLVEAQPLIGTLARDPSLRGLFDTLSLFITGAEKDQNYDAIARLDPTLTAVGAAVQAVLEGRYQPVSWQRLMTGLSPDRRELRRFVLARAVLDTDELEPGARPRAEVRRLARELGLDPQHGVRVRLTGSVSLNDEQFTTLQQGAVESTVLSLLSVCALLLAAVRSLKLVGAILATLVAGLVLTGAFAALAIGSLNLISVAFGVLFIGLGVDFGIQFSVRYRDERYRRGGLPEALRGAATTIGPSILLAGVATASGFLAFVPTSYTGIRELGWIAGFGMLIAVVLNLVLLPALLTLVRPRGEPAPVGFGWAAPLDRFLSRRRRWVIAGSAVLAAASLALLPEVRFDFDPLNLKNPNSESVRTARDLMDDPMTTPYTAEVLAPSLPEAETIAGRLAALPQVAQAITAASFIPEQQEQKLAILGDLRLLLGPTLTPEATLPPPGNSEIRASMLTLRDALQPAAARAAGSGEPDGPAARLSRALGEAGSRGAGIVPALQEALLTGLEQRLDTLRQIIDAQPVTLETLPPQLRDSWITPDGRARVEVFPKEDARNHEALKRFVAAVRTVAPNATGTPVTIQEAGRLFSSAFLQAGIIAVLAIAALLAITLRRVRDVALVVAPLLLASILTLAVTVVIGKPLNYANVIALPLLLGIGVAFNIYFVMNWRAGQTNHLQSSTARAVLFSALTTMAAFGSLALSPDPGTAEMGMLLTISLFCTLVCALLVLPALLGPAKAEAAAGAANCSERSNPWRHIAGRRR
jgi:hopanoid biosynthesis associated RND transporter like protein HpnN